ncbi:MAG: YggT family protein [Gemmatimonadetes bacterium]|nr:YggT family protein [Gemmatimonadota bacterium]MBI2537563.1 YggT family protein [Gemmatimonadota bacterium]
MNSLFDLLRYAVFAVLVLSAVIALGSWAVRTRRISPFSGAARLIRTLTDPIINPMERWVLRRGGNPQHAPWWLLGLVVVGGILVITVAQWLVVQLGRASFAATAGPRGVLRLAVYYLGQLVLIALIVRVIASWFGVFRYSRWMRPAYLLTDWIVEPLRRIIPPIGMIDITPLVAWFGIRIALSWLMNLL